MVCDQSVQVNNGCQSLGNRAPANVPERRTGITLTDGVVFSINLSSGIFNIIS